MNIYDYQKPLGKIEDDTNLRNEFITSYDLKTHEEIADFSIRYGKHLIEITGFNNYQEVFLSFEAIQKWIDKKVNYHEARNISFVISRLAKSEIDIIKVKFLRTMAQIAAVPHVKYHGLWATDFAITLINRLFPGDISKVKEERLKQIELLTTI